VALRRAGAATREHDRTTAEDSAAQADLLELTERIEEERGKHAGLEQRIRELDGLRGQQEALVKRVREEAERACPLTPEAKAMMAELPGDLEALRSELVRLKARHALLVLIDPTIGERFAEAERNRDETQAKISAAQAAVEAAAADLGHRFVSWRVLIGADVDRMNAAFQGLIAACQYRGEVRLDPDDRDAIESYRLSLMVAFDRISHLSILTSARQSGGEKSVATLLFLLALQDCSKFPFRVVDEINQGMDEINERNTFCQVMSHAVRRNQDSQYFLVTPKLLPHLDFIEGVTVLVVMNGPFIRGELSSPVTFDNAFDETV
jgi:chromosome segregation ATPase